MPRYLDIAAELNIARPYDKRLPAWVTAVVVRGGRVLSVGYNEPTTRGVGLRDAYRVKNHPESLHAEVSAILSVRNKIDLTGSKIYVARHKRETDGKIITAHTQALAKPCLMCQAICYAYGIKRAYFTISDTEYGVMKITDPRR